MVHDEITVVFSGVNGNQPNFVSIESRMSKMENDIEEIKVLCKRYIGVELSKISINQQKIFLNMNEVLHADRSVLIVSELDDLEHQITEIKKILIYICPENVLERLKNESKRIDTARASE